MHAGGISIWFFIGLSLLVNGILIFGAGVWEIVRPPANPVVLFHLHANVAAADSWLDLLRQICART